MSYTISQLTPKGERLAANDILEIEKLVSPGVYETKSITGQEIKDFAGGSGGGVHCLTPPYSGRVYIPVTNYGVLVNQSTTGNVIRLYLFIPAQNITVSSLSINVGTAGAGVSSRILIYDNLDGYPNSKVIESTDLSCATTGLKTFTTTYTFTAGTTYWVGCYNTGAFSQTHIPATNMLMVNLPTFPTNAYTGFTYGYPFGSAPASLNAITPSTTNGIFPVIYFNI